MRVNEVARLQGCDLWFDHLMSYGVPDFDGTCSVHIDRRKNETERKGHYPAFGRSQDPELDIVVQLRTLRTRVSPCIDSCSQCARVLFTPSPRSLFTPLSERPSTRDRRVNSLLSKPIRG